MFGAILGDIIGSPYEFDHNNIKTKNFPLFSRNSQFTDDTVMTIAIAEAILYADGDLDDLADEAVASMQKLGRLYPYAGYGARFVGWVHSDNPKPYNSLGNGAAMRVSPVAWAFDDMETVRKAAVAGTAVTHNHPEGIRGAQAVASAIFLARNGADKDEIREYIEENYYDLDFTVDGIRDGYSFDVTCQGSVPEAIVCFLDSTDFEDAIRNAVSLGGDADTQACIAGSIAEAYYGIPDSLQEEIFDYIDDVLKDYYWSYADELY